MIPRWVQPFYEQWLGHQPLGRAFWLFGFVGFFASSSLVIFLVERPLQLIGLNGLGHGLVYVWIWVYAVFAWVGIWRSADAAHASPGWALAAKAAVILFAITMLQGFIKGGGVASVLGLLTSSN
jgi:hypothetical protein